MVKFVIMTSPRRRRNLAVVLISLDRGNFLIVQTCSTLSLQRQVAQAQDVEFKNAVKFEVFRKKFSFTL